MLIFLLKLLKSVWHVYMQMEKRSYLAKITHVSLYNNDFNPFKPRSRIVKKKNNQRLQVNTLNPERITRVLQ